MSDNIVISIDLMGGDMSPLVLLRGVEDFAKTFEDVNFILHGDSNQFKSYLKESSILKNRYELVHSDNYISGDLRPSNVIRKSSKVTSMHNAVNSVKEKNAHGLVSCGNTGALSALALFSLGMIDKVKRPAIVTSIPNVSGRTVMLDLGANINCTTTILVQHAVIGSAFCKSLYGVEEPKIGLLNVGSEFQKGLEELKQAHILLSESSLNFAGFVEGDNIFDDNIDVIVTDGFTGNVSLKSIEGCAGFFKTLLTKMVKKNIFTKISGLLIKKFTANIFNTYLDPRQHNGAMLGGVNGVVIKSHGSADDVAFKNAISVAYQLIKHDINKKIYKEIYNINSSLKETEGEK